MAYLPTGPDNTWEYATPEEFAAHYLGGGANIQNVKDNGDGTHTIQVGEGSDVNYGGGHYSGAGSITIDQNGHQVGQPQGFSGGFTPWAKDSGPGGILGAADSALGSTANFLGNYGAPAALTAMTAMAG